MPPMTSPPGRSTRVMPMSPSVLAPWPSIRATYWIGIVLDPGRRVGRSPQHSPPDEAMLCNGVLNASLTRSTDEDEFTSGSAPSCGATPGERERPCYQHTPTGNASWEESVTSGRATQEDEVELGADEGGAEEGDTSGDPPVVPLSLTA